MSVVATFRGKHNYIKSTMFVLMANAHRAYNLRELVILSGCGYYSLSVLLGRWVKWRYVLRGYDRARHVNTYSLARRGHDFVDYRIPWDILRDVDRDLSNRWKYLVHK